MLSRARISELKLVLGLSDESARASSYDLRIESVIDSSGTIHYEPFVLNPQEVAWVISKEVVSLPDNITAIAHIKTSLCNDGLLALNTGVVDPLWDGPLSTPILNFGKSRHVLRQNDEFLRLTFYEHAPEASSPPKKSTRAKYTADKQDRAVKYFGKKFLDADAILKEAFENNILRYASHIGITIAIFVAAVGAVLTLGATFINSSAFYAPGYYSSYSAKASEAHKELLKKLDEVEAQLKAFKESNR